MVVPQFFIRGFSSNKHLILRINVLWGNCEHSLQVLGLASVHAPKYVPLAINSSLFNPHLGIKILSTCELFLVSRYNSHVLRKINTHKYFSVTLLVNTFLFKSTSKVEFYLLSILFLLLSAIFGFQANVLLVKDLKYNTRKCP